MRTRARLLYRPPMPPAGARGPYVVPPPISVAVLAGALPVATLAGYWLLRRGAAPWLAAAVALGAALLVYALASRRARRRRRLARAPFPPAWREALLDRVGFYARLEGADRARFEYGVQVFLAEQTIDGPRGAAVRDETRVLVAASATILAFGLPPDTLSSVRDVVIYPEAFDEEYRVARGAEMLGQVHAQGPVILSERALVQGFERGHDGLNVGLHELAHVLDFEGGVADGIPSTMPWKSIRPWLEVVHREMRRAGKHGSALRSYGATNEAELFAVAVEAFFEHPAQLQKKHGALYAMLVEALGQDPAALLADESKSG